jgi:hypothetical protein
MKDDKQPEDTDSLLNRIVELEEYKKELEQEIETLKSKLQQTAKRELSAEEIDALNYEEVTTD